MVLSCGFRTQAAEPLSATTMNSHHRLLLAATCLIANVCTMLLPPLGSTIGEYRGGSGAFFAGFDAFYSRAFCVFLVSVLSLIHHRLPFLAAPPLCRTSCAPPVPDRRPSDRVGRRLMTEAPVGPRLVVAAAGAGCSPPLLVAVLLFLRLLMLLSGPPRSPWRFASAYSWGGHVSDCVPRTYTASRTYCESSAVQGRLATTLRTKAAAEAAVSSLCSAKEYYYFIVGAPYDDAAGWYHWLDDGTAFNGPWVSTTLINWPLTYERMTGSWLIFFWSRDVPANCGFVNHESIAEGGASFDFGDYVPLCEVKMCDAAECSAAGTQTVETSRRLSAGGCCTCKANFAGAQCDSCAPDRGPFPNCDQEYCSLRGNTCDAGGTEAYHAGNVRPNCCTCKPRYAGASCEACANGYFGSGCASEYCWLQGDTCHAQGTSLYNPNSARPSGCCTCRATHQGDLCNACSDGYTAMPSCADEYCWLRGDTCHGPGTVLYSPGNIRPGGGGGGVGAVGCCTCRPQYVGTSCETRVCHADYDCQGRAITSTSDNALRIAGTYPDCACRCLLGYGGRRCRTLTETASLTVTVSRSGPLTASVTAFLTSTASTTLSTTPSVSPTLTSTRSRTLSPTGSMGSRSASGTASDAPTPSVSLSVSSSASFSGTGSQTVSPSLPVTASGGTGSLSATASTTASGTASPSRSPTPSCTVTRTVSVASPSLSASFTCPVETYADRADLPRTSTWGGEPGHPIVSIRALQPVVFVRVPGTSLRAGNGVASPAPVDPSSLPGADASAAPSSSRLPVVSEVDPTLYHTLLLRSDVQWKGGFIRNLTGFVELLRGPAMAWQPQGLRSRGSVRAVVDFDGDMGVVTAHVPLLEGFLVDEEEEAIVYVSAQEMFGCGDGGLWLSVASLIITPPPRTGLQEAASVASNTASLLSGANDLQAIAIIGLMPCSGGLTSQLAGSGKRSLSPFALSDAWLGVLAGNGLAMVGGLALMGVLVVGASAHVRRGRYVMWGLHGHPRVGEAKPSALEMGDGHPLFSDRTGLLGALALLRCPAMPIKGAVYLYAGTLAACVGGVVDGVSAMRGEAVFDPLSDPASEASAVPVFGNGPVEVCVSLFFFAVVVVGLPAWMVAYSARYVSRGFAAFDYSRSVLEPSWAGAGSGDASPSGGVPSAGARFLASVLLPCGVFVPREDTVKMFGVMVSGSRHPPLPLHHAGGGHRHPSATNPSSSSSLQVPALIASSSPSSSFPLSSSMPDDDLEMDLLLAPVTPSSGDGNGAEGIIDAADDDPLGLFGPAMPSDQATGDAAHPCSCSPAAPPLPYVYPSSRVVRHARHSLLWFTLPFWSTWLAGVGQVILVRDEGLCRGAMGALGAAHFGLAALVLAVRPHTVLFASLASAGGLALTGVVLVCSMLLIGDADSPMARGALTYAVTAQVVLSSARTVHVGCVMAWYQGVRLYLRWRDRADPPSPAPAGPAPKMSAFFFSDGNVGGGAGPSPSLTTPPAQQSASHQRDPHSPSSCSASPAAVAIPLVWFYDVDQRRTGANQEGSDGGGKGAPPARRCLRPGAALQDTALWLSALPYDDGTSWPAYFRARLVDPLLGAFGRLGRAHPPAVPFAHVQPPLIGPDHHAYFGDAFGFDPEEQQEELLGVPLSCSDGGHQETSRADPPDDALSNSGSSDDADDDDFPSGRHRRMRVAVEAADMSATMAATGRLRAHSGYVFRRAEELHARRQREAALERRQADEEAMHLYGRLGYSFASAPAAAGGAEGSGLSLFF